MSSSPSRLSSSPPAAATPRSEPTGERVVVSAPARLHLGFLDPNGALGRRFGSIGLVIDGLATTVAMNFAARDRIDAAPAARHELARLRAHLAALRSDARLERPLDVYLQETLPAHVGLGSGTQLALTVGRAFAALHRLPLTTAQIALQLARGLRSGVGVAGFDRGGLLVDGGPQAPGRIAPLLARLELPSAWRVLLVLDPGRAGLHGAAERTALAALPPFESAAAAHLCHLVLMRILPAAAEADFAPFAAGITELQRTIGAYFAPAQGGSMFLSPTVARVLEWAARECGAGVGQSSWGPTGFAFFPSQRDAEDALARALREGIADPALQLSIVKGRNDGAQIAWSRIEAPAALAL
jgi:beta-RFAP synthase